MKKILAILCAIATATSAYAFPYYTNSGVFGVATSAISDYAAFDWTWSGIDDQAFDLAFDTPITNGSFALRLTYPKRGNIYLEVQGWTISGITNADITISSTNVPPNNTYYAEFMLVQTNPSPTRYRSLAKGKIKTMYSLWEGTNFANGGWANVVAPISTNVWVTSITGGTNIDVASGGNAYTVNHSDTSSQTNINAAGGSVVQDFYVDTDGHATNVVTVNLDGRYYTETESDALFISTNNANFLSNNTHRTSTGSDHSLVGTLQTATGALNTAVVALQGSTNALNTQVVALNTATGALNTTSVALVAATNALNTSVVALNTATGALNTSVVALNTATNALNTRATSLETATNALNTQVVALNTATGALNTSVVALDAKFDDAQSLSLPDYAATFSLSNNLTNSNPDITGAYYSDGQYTDVTTNLSFRNEASNKFCWYLDAASAYVVTPAKGSTTWSFTNDEVTTNYLAMTNFSPSVNSTGDVTVAYTGITSKAFDGGVMVAEDLTSQLATPTLVHAPTGDVAMAGDLSVAGVAGFTGKASFSGNVAIDGSDFIEMGGASTIRCISTGPRIIDGVWMSLGSSDDSILYYDGADTLWNLANAGSGDLHISGGNVIISNDLNVAGVIGGGSTNHGNAPVESWGNGYGLATSSILFGNYATGVFGRWYLPDASSAQLRIGGTRLCSFTSSALDGNGAGSYYIEGAPSSTDPMYCQSGYPTTGYSPLFNATHHWTSLGVSIMNLTNGLLTVGGRVNLAEGTATNDAMTKTYIDAGDYTSNGVVKVSIRPSAANVPAAIYTGFWNSYDFVDTSDKTAWLSFEYPDNGDTNEPITVGIPWKENDTGANSGLVFQINARYVALGETTTQAVAEVILRTCSVANVAHQYHYEEITLDNTLIQEDDVVQLELIRLTTDGGDDWTGHAGVKFIADVHYILKK